MLGNLSFQLGVLLCSLLLAHVHYADADTGAIESECRDRYFIMTVDYAIVNWLRIEAEDATGVHDISDVHAATCGYTYSPVGREGYVSLRASYLSCHTENQNDQLFTFKFNIICADTVYHVAKTCSLPVPWSAREVTCDHNYMEVSVQKNTPCTPSSHTSKEAWSSIASSAHSSEVSRWQVMFLKDGQEVTMSISEAQAHGYGLAVTANRVVFRSAYWQLHTQDVSMDGIMVMVIHATMFYRHKWMVTLMDLSAACALNHGDFDANTRRLFWEIPAVFTPLVYDRSEFVSKQVSMGMEVQLLDENTWRARGYSLDTRGPVMNLSVPFGAEGGYRRSFVHNNTYNEFYTIDLYYEHLFMDGALETRHRMVMFCLSPLLSQHPFTIDQTVLEEFVFTVYLGNFPSDVELVTVKLNGETFSVAKAFQSGYTITEVPHPNGTHAYALKVPFEDPIIPRMYLGEGLLQYSLDINYTLNIMPYEDPYYHLASVVALLEDAFPPDLKGVCTENRVIFKMDHPKRGHLWELTIGNYPLTSELVAGRGYIMQNNSQSLTLEVPVFTIGFTYKKITLKQFFGTFEVLVRDAKTLDIQKSTTKHCLFNTDELMVCSTDGVMTVVASFTAAIPPVEPSRTTLLDKNCKPRDADATRALFAFGVNTCGTRVLIGDHYLVYENEIMFHRELAPEGVPIITRDSGFRLTVQCFYQINSTNRLFVDKTFKSEMPGFGSIKVEGSSSKTYGTAYEPTLPRSIPSHHGAPYAYSNNGVTHIGNEVPQSGDHSTRYSISRLNSASTVPSTNQGSHAQHGPHGVQPALRSYGTFQTSTNQRFYVNSGALKGVHLHVPGHHRTAESSGTTQRVRNHYKAPQAGRTQHVPSSTHSHTSTYTVHESGSHPNRYSASRFNGANPVPSTHESSHAQDSPNSVHPALSSNRPVHGSTSQRVSVNGGAGDVQHVSDHHRSAEGGSSSTARRVLSHYVAPQAGSTNVFQPALRSYGAVKGVGVHVPGQHGTTGSSSITQVSSRYEAHQVGRTQHVPSSTHSHSSPYTVNQSGGHPNRYSAFQLNTGGSHAKHVPNSIQPALRSNGPVQGSATQRVSVRSGAVVGVKVQYVHSHRGASQARGTQHTPNSVQPTLCSYGTANCSSTTKPQVSSSYGGYRHAESYEFTQSGSAPNTFSAAKVVPRHYGSIKGVGTQPVRGHYSDNSGIKGQSPQQDLGEVQSVPVTYGLIRSRGSPPSSVAHLHGSQELQFPQGRRSDSSEVQPISDLSGAFKVYPRSHKASKSDCIFKRLKVGPNQSVRVRSSTHRGSRTDVHGGIKTGQRDS